MKKEGFPRWAAQEIAGADWSFREGWRGSGFVLDVYPDKMQIDVQFYDRLPEGRFIATLDVPPAVPLNNFRVGEAYLFDLKIYAASLSRALTEFLAKEYSVRIDAIYRFELVSAEPLA